MSNLLPRRLRSGQTMRYHTTPHLGAGQTVSDHAWRATVLLHTLWPEHASKNAILYMLYHDAAEQQLGDMPAPTKWSYKELSERYAEAEKQEELRLGLEFDLTPDEMHICKMADMLELVDYIGHRIIRGDHSFEARDIYWNGRKHLLMKYAQNVLFGEAREHLTKIHAQVVQACPLAGAHLV
jgi:hypothetical protein